MDIKLRPEQPGDQQFLFALYASTRAKELEHVPWSESQKKDFLNMQFNAQSTHYHQHYPDAAYQIILSGQQPIGRLYVDRGLNEVHVIDIALLPEFRGGGIGGDLLRRLLVEAAEKQEAVQIFVERENPARRLYTRLGFRVVEDKGVYLLMKWIREPDFKTSSIP